MPLVYDQSRCCAELSAKNKLRALLHQGFRPADDFNVPLFNTRKGSDVTVDEHVDNTNTDGDGTLPPETTLPVDESSPLGKAAVILNKRNGVVHRRHNEFAGTSQCPHVKDASLPHYETFLEDTSKLREYRRCLICFGGRSMEAPENQASAETEDVVNLEEKQYKSE